MDELIDVLNSDGTPTGMIRWKSDVHRDGLWHLSVHTWIVTPDRKLILQRRARTKENHPGLWDISSAGHVSAGELAVDAAARELEEEIGLVVPPGDLERIGSLREQWVLRNGSYIDNELHELFLCVRPVDVSALVCQAAEVDEVAVVALEKFRERVASRNPDLVPHWSEYEVVLEILEQRFGHSGPR
jgi:isopentenyl-diphosphate Delta-isomerase